MTTPPSILVIDDEPHSLRLTARVLGKAGYQVMTATNGEDGLCAARSERPALVLLNVVLPDIGGIEVCRRIKADASLVDTCVILLSASETASESQATGLEAGADGYIARPTSNRELLARVQAILRLKQAEQDLRRYEVIISSVADPISYVDRSYVYRAVNETYASYAMRPCSEIVGLTVAELLGEGAFQEHVKPRLDRCFGGEHVHYQAWFDVPGQEKKYMDVSYSPVFAGDGSVIGAAVNSRDITARKQIEEALRESRRFFQSALDALSPNIAIIDQDGTIIAVNASWCDFGSENDLAWTDCGVGRNYLAVLDASTGEASEGAPEAAQGIRDVIAGKLDRFWQEYPCHSSWEQRWYAMWVTRFESTKGVRAVIAHENVTERKLSELALLDAKETAEAAQQEAETARQEEARRRAIAESLRDILSILNSNRPLQQVLDHIVVQARQLLGSQAVAIYRLEEKAGQLTLRSAQGLPDECPLHGENPAILMALRHAVYGGKPVSLPRPNPGTQADAQDAYIACSGACQALLAIPITVKDAVYGGILLCNTEPRTFNDDDIKLAVVFGDQVALAIENARLRDQVEQTAVAAERSRLARDLHDAVTQTLFSASLIAETLPRIWQQYPEEAERGLDELRQLTRGALAEMRALLLELRPAALTEKSLGELLRNLTDATNSRTRVPISLETREDGAPPANVQVVLYRLAQEALNNVAKHARASLVTVSLDCQPTQVELAIRDDGNGFDLEAIPAGHLGIGIMRERADAIGAQLDIHTHPGQGTEILVRWTERGGKQANGNG